MKIIGDIERVNLSTGRRYVRVTGDGESRLVEQSGPVSSLAKCPNCGHRLHEGLDCQESDCCGCGQ
jgi:hypothetical protein